MTALGTRMDTLLGGIGDLARLVPADPSILIGLVAGVAVVAVLLLAYRAVLAFRDKAKASPFLERMKGAMARTPSAVADPAKRARLDDLRKKYEEGVDKFRQAGKDLYSLPWYLLVGPAGSGKTEAMRHCKVGFPPGLQDCFQGAGGTVNMHWWFTNQAVVLDTAGRMFMEEAALQGGSEWREFLKMLKQSRPNAPVNGMLLVIGVDSLIKETSEQIEARAGHIAKQLDTIQRTLDVRFPVYVVITKCDLITGFKEFFDQVDDPQLQNQILGWSNPAPLDEQFRAEAVDDHIRTIRARLLKRRATLLMDPVHTEDPQARRTEQVDELFALPDNMAKIAPRLRRYLEIIFQAGEWSPKPLFLRGIYFTSSMRQGKALDEDLAAALGVNVDAIPGGKVYDEERSFFLRDVFTAKIFREKGLVSRATNVQKEQTGRKRLLLGAGIGLAAALIGLTFLSSAQLRQTVRDPQEKWAEIAAWLDKGNEVVRDAGSTPAYFGGSEKEVEIDGRQVKASPIELIRRSRELADSPLSMGFLSFGRVFDDVNRNQKEAHLAVVSRLAAAPMFRWAREELKARRLPWSRPAAGTLAELVAAETRARGAKPAREADGKPFAAGQINPAPILAYFILTKGGGRPDAAGGELGAWGLKTEVAREDFDVLVQELGKITPEDYPRFGLAGTEDTLKALEQTIGDRVKDGWREQALNGGGLREFRELDEALAGFRDGARGLDALLPAQAPATIEAYNETARRFAEQVAVLKDKKREAVASRLADWDGGLKLLSAEELAQRAQKDVDEQQKQVLGALPAEAKAEGAKDGKGKRLEDLAALLKKARDESLDGLAPQVKQMLAAFGADREKQALLGPGVLSDERGYQAVLRLYETVQGVLVKAEPPADWLDAERGMAEVNSAAEAARKAVAGWQEKAPGLSRFADQARAALSLARGGRVGAVGGAFVEGLDKGVAEAVESSKDAVETNVPRIPMADPDGGKAVGKRFCPPAANRMLQGWAAVNAELSGPEKQWVVAEAPTLEKAARLKTSVAEYGQQYVDQWTTVLKRSEVRRFATWKQFHAALREENPDPVLVHQGLKPLHRLVEANLRAAGKALARSDWLTRADEVAGKAAKIEAADTGPTGVLALGKDALRDLGDNAGKARDVVVSRMKKGPGGLRDFTNVVDADSTPEYWKSLMQQGFQSLAEEYQASSAGLLQELKGLARFPLVADGTPADGLTPEQLARAKVILDGLPLPDASSSGLPPAGRLQSACKELVESAIFAENPKLVEFVGRGRVVADLLTQEEGTRLIKSIQGAGETMPIPGRPEVGNLSTVLRLWGHSEDLKQPGANDREPVNLTNNAKVRMLGAGAGGQALGLYFCNDADPEAERTFPGPWAAVQLILTPGARPAVAGSGGKSSEWFVPIVVPFKGADYRMWIKVELLRAAPTRGEWPTASGLSTR